MAVSRSPLTRGLTYEFVLILAASLILVCTTVGLEYHQQAAGAARLSSIGQQFHLGYENNFAAWFSGSLLALICLHALDGVTANRTERPGVARAWAMIGGVMIYLSADELGWLHERISLLGRAIGVGNWGLILPLGAFFAAVLGWALLRLWIAGGAHRRQVLLMLCGFAVLGSVVMQEFLEHNLSWDGALALAARVGFEEGSELSGMLFVLASAMANTRTLLQDTSPQRRPVFAILSDQRGRLVLALVVLAPVLTLVTMHMYSVYRGRPGDWLAAMTFSACAAIMFGRWLEAQNNPTRLFACALFLLLSCACVAIDPGNLFQTDFMDTTKRAMVIVPLLLVTIGLNWRLGLMVTQPLPMVAIPGLCLGLLLPETRPTVILLTVALGATTYWALSVKPETRAARDGLAKA